MSAKAEDDPPQNLCEAITSALLQCKQQGRRLHLVEALRTARDTVAASDQTHIDALLTEIENEPDGVFDHENPAYEAVVAFVRGLEKVQRHAHIGSSTSPGFAWDEFAVHKVTLARVLAKKKELSAEEVAGLLALRALVDEANPKRWDELDGPSQKAAWGLFSMGLLKPKNLVVDSYAFTRQVEHVAQRHFTDGVTDLTLLVKITDRDFAGPSEAAKAAIEGLKNATEAANGNSGGRFVAKLGASFPREGPEGYPATVMRAVGEIIALRNTEKWYQDSIVAIDISGPEALMDHTRNTHYWATSDFRDALQLAANNGLRIMAHLGDWGNTYRVPEAIPTREPGVSRRMALAHIPDREEMVKRLLIFVRDGIETLRDVWKAVPAQTEPEVDPPIVNHGIALALPPAVITKGTRPAPPRERTRYAFPGQTIADRANVTEIHDLLGIIAEGAFEIRTCPTVNIRSKRIGLYRRHPFFEWLRKGVKAAIDVDDLYWHGLKTSLSDDIAKMMLAAPRWAQCEWDGDEGKLYLRAGRGRAYLGRMRQPDEGER